MSGVPSQGLSNAQFRAVFLLTQAEMRRYAAIGCSVPAITDPEYRDPMHLGEEVILQVGLFDEPILRRNLGDYVYDVDRDTPLPAWPCKEFTY